MRFSRPHARSGRARNTLVFTALLWQTFSLSINQVHGVYFDYYHTTDDILARLESLATSYPDRVRKNTLHDPETGVHLPAYKFTDFTVDNDKARSFMSCGEHARELISSEVCYWFARMLAGDPGEQLQWSDTAYAHTISRLLFKDTTQPLPDSIGDWVTELLKRIEYVIVPVEVPESRRQVEQGDTCRRKTPTGVDLNRNWQTAFQHLSRNSETYGGEHPFSEPASRMLRDWSAVWKPHVWTTVHSGEWALYLPWDHKRGWGEVLPADGERLLQRMNEHCECVTGPAGSVAGYLAYGTSMDYFYVEGHVPYPVTVEVYGDNNEGKRPTPEALRKRVRPQRRQLAEEQPLEAEAGIESKGEELGMRGTGARALQGIEVPRPRSCFNMFNPNTEQSYRDVIARWVSAFLVMGEHVARSVESGDILHLRDGSRSGQNGAVPNAQGALLRGGQPRVVPSQKTQTLNIRGQPASVIPEAKGSSATVDVARVGQGSQGQPALGLTRAQSRQQHPHPTSAPTAAPADPSTVAVFLVLGISAGVVLQRIRRYRKRIPPDGKELD